MGLYFWQPYNDQLLA